MKGDNIPPNSDLNITQELVTKLTRHETSHLYCLAFQKSIAFHTETLPWNSRAEIKFLAMQVSQHCRSGTVFCEAPGIVFEEEITRFVVNVPPCMMTLMPK